MNIFRIQKKSLCTYGDICLSIFIQSTAKPQKVITVIPYDHPYRTADRIRARSATPRDVYFFCIVQSTMKITDRRIRPKYPKNSIWFTYVLCENIL